MRKQNRRLAIWFAFVMAFCLLLSLSAGAEDAVMAEESAEITVSLEDGEYESLPISGMSNDQLAKGYIDQFFAPGRRTLRAPKPQGDQLTGTAKNIYDFLKTEIAKVAEGQRDSTEFEVPLGSFTKRAYTSAELGVDYVALPGDDGTLIMTEEAEQAFSLRIQEQMQLNKVIRALLADNPYELYWYDKTEGNGTAASMGTSFLEGYAELEALTVYMTVSQEYRDNDQYKVDGALYGQNVKPALQNARRIIEENEGKSNYERLKAYKNEICGLTGYNYAAANEENNTPYGNPWQMIWVFDGNNETNVVCEGYSKAFQYLNDHSAGSAKVISVTGTLIGRDSSGGHMWNIAAMEDGKNYLVDVTNCDSGMVGSPDRLFLAIPTSGSGSADDPYVFVIDANNTVRYVYDGQQLFSASDLTLATTGYTVVRPDFGIRINDLDAASVSILTNEKVMITGYARNAAHAELQIWDTPDGEPEMTEAEGEPVFWRYGWEASGEKTIQLTAYYSDGTEQTETVQVNVASNGTLGDPVIQVDSWQKGETLRLYIVPDARTGWSEIRVWNGDHTYYSSPEGGDQGSWEYEISADILGDTDEVKVAVRQAGYGVDASFKEVTVRAIDPSGTLCLPENLERIEEEAFAGDSSVTHVKIPDSVSFIGENAFAGCGSLGTVMIPETVTGIQENAFVYDNITIYGRPGSQAEQYAREHGISFVQAMPVQ